MAKQKPDIADMFTPSSEAARPASMVDPSKSPEQIEIPQEGRTVPTSIGLKESEVAIVDAIAAELGTARNGLLRFLVREGLRQYLAGETEIEFRPSYSLRQDKRQIKFE